MINKKKKLEIINKLIDLLSNHNSIYLIDIFKMNVMQINIFRQICFDYNIIFFVVKNTLLKRSLNLIKNKKLNNFLPILKNNSSLILANKENLPANIINIYRNKVQVFNQPIFKGAYVQETFYIGENNFNLLLHMKSKEELIINIIYSLKFIFNKVICSITSYHNILLECLNVISKK